MIKNKVYQVLSQTFNALNKLCTIRFTIKPRKIPISKITIPAIRLGINAELDHISPLFMGGENGLKNVHWVIGTINRFKGFQAEKDFLNLIKKIYEFKIKS